MNLGRLFEQPIAHRGLHDKTHGIIENSRAAVWYAMQAGYGFEVDVQISADGEAMVFHDETLDRLTGYTGALRNFTAEQLCAVPLRGSSDGDTLWTLAELLELVAGQAPAVIEIKTHWDHDPRLATRVGELLTRYKGPIAAKSFDPLLVAAFARAAPDVPRGIVGYGYDDEETEQLPALKRWKLRNLLHWPRTRPHFISWGVKDLPRRSVSIASRLTGAPVMTWTVRTPAEQARAALFADQMIFEGFRP